MSYTWKRGTRKAACPNCGSIKAYNTAVDQPDGTGHCFKCGKTSHPPKTAAEIAEWKKSQSNYRNYRPEPEPPVVYKELPDAAVAALNPNLPPDNFIAYALGLGVTRQHLSHCGVGVDIKSGGVVFLHYIPTMYRPVFAKCVQYLKSGKRDKSDKGRIVALYTASAGYAQPCYFAGRFIPTKSTIIVESEKTAVIASYCYPVFNFIAIAGVSGLTTKKTELLKGLFAKKTVLVLLDNDEAGNNAVGPVLSKLKYAGIEAIEMKLTTLFPNAGAGWDLADAIEAKCRALAAYKSEIGIDTSPTPQNALPAKPVSEPALEPALLRAVVASKSESNINTSLAPSNALQPLKINQTPIIAIVAVVEPFTAPQPKPTEQIDPKPLVSSQTVPQPTVAPTATNGRIDLNALLNSVLPFCKGFDFMDTVTAVRELIDVNYQLQFSGPALEKLIQLIAVRYPTLNPTAVEPVAQIDWNPLVDSVFPFCKAFEVEDTIRVGIDLIEVMHGLPFSQVSIDNIKELIAVRHHQMEAVRVK